MSTCPTPLKSRFATQEAAESAAKRAALGVGTLLHPYPCDEACGWWHLTSKPRRIEPPLTTADIAAVHQLDDAGFRQLVSNDARGGASRLRARALRDPSLASRWINMIKTIQRDIGEQLRLRAGQADPETRTWRAKAGGFQQALAQRRAEAVEIVRVQGSSVAVIGRDATERDRREAAGELAVNRLIAAHQAQFAELLAEEYARLGIALPGRIQRHLERHRAEAGEQP